MPSQWAKSPLRLRAGVNMWSPKPQTFKSKIYLAFVKALPCVVGHNCEGDVVAHHTSTGGMGCKGSDADAIPLCHKHHDEHDHIGKVSFYLKYNLDRWQCVAKTLEVFVVKMLEK